MLTEDSVLYMQLSVSHLRKVLEAFRQGRRLPATPLKLLIPRQYRSYSLSYGGDEAHSLAGDAALIEWIKVEITRELARQRRYHKLRPPKKVSSRSEAIAAMRLDFQQGHEVLATWSILFYLYVRVDVDLSNEEVSRITAYEERTLRRRKERGLRRLAHHLLRSAVYNPE